MRRRTPTVSEPMTPCYIQAVGLINALGNDVPQVVAALRQPELQPLREHTQPLHDGRRVMVGAVSSRSLMPKVTTCSLALPAASVATTVKL